MIYIYLQTEKHLWTVGFYAPDGSFQPEKDFGIDEGGAEAAARRVAWLNGGGSNSEKAVKDLEATVGEVLSWADKFDARTGNDIVKIVAEMSVANFPATEATMFFNGLKRALILFYDDAKPSGKVPTFADGIRAQLKAEAEEKEINAALFFNDDTKDFFREKYPKRYAELLQNNTVNTICTCLPNALLGRGDCGHFRACPLYTKI